MAFNLTPDVEVTRDRNQRVRALDHLRQPYLAGTREQSLTALGDAYLADVAHIYDIALEALKSLDDRDTQPDRNQRERLVRVDVTPLPDGSGTVVYAQRCMNLDVWQAGIAASMLANPLRVLSSRSTYHHDIKVTNADVLQLHPTFPKPNQRVQSLGDPQQPFALRATGRGVFELNAKVTFKTGETRTLKHVLTFDLATAPTGCPGPVTIGQHQLQLLSKGKGGMSTYAYVGSILGKWQTSGVPVTLFSRTRTSFTWESVTT